MKTQFEYRRFVRILVPTIASNAPATNDAIRLNKIKYQIQTASRAR